MPDVSYTTVMRAPRSEVWEFVRDMNNWAPFARGYQSHEIIDERDSIWTVKGDLGPISRVTKFHITITEWIEGERVAFTLAGLNEPITGQGAIQLSDNGGAETQIRGEATLLFGGTLAPVVNHLIGPWVQSGADELVARIVAAVTGEEVVMPRRGVALLFFALGRLLASAWRRLVGLPARLFRRRRGAAPW